MTIKAKITDLNKIREEEEEAVRFKVYRKTQKENEAQFWNRVRAKEYKPWSLTRSQDLNVSSLLDEYNPVRSLNYEFSCIIKADGFKVRFASAAKINCELDGRLLLATVQISTQPDQTRRKQQIITLIYQNATYYIMKEFEWKNGIAVGMK